MSFQRVLVVVNANIILVVSHHVSLFECPGVLLVRVLLGVHKVAHLRLPPWILVQSASRSVLLVEQVRSLASPGVVPAVGVAFVELVVEGVHLNWAIQKALERCEH